VLGEALAAAKAIGDEDRRSGALGALAPYLSPEQLDEALICAKAIGDENRRSGALSALVGWLLSNLQVDGLLALIDSVGNVSRPASLSAVIDSSRPTFELGGQEAVLELRRSINDVCSWYP